MEDQLVKVGPRQVIVIALLAVVGLLGMHGLTAHGHRGPAAPSSIGTEMTTAHSEQPTHGHAPFASVPAPAADAAPPNDQGAVQALCAGSCDAGTGCLALTSRSDVTPAQARLVGSRTSATSAAVVSPPGRQDAAPPDLVAALCISRT